MPILRRILLAVLLLVVGFDCDDDATKPPEESFGLEVRVHDADGAPIEGAQVVVWNMSASLEDFLQDEVFRRRAATVVRFSMPRRAVCDFFVYDLDGQLLQSVVEEDTLEAGVHAVLLGPELEFDAGVEVMRYEMVARAPEDGEELFRDERWMTAVHLDRSRLVAQLTDATGRWSTSDPTFVPGFYELPTLQAVDESSQEIGTFTLGSTLIVRVYGETGGYLQKTISVRDAANVVDFTWAEGRLTRDEPVTKERVDRGASRVDAVLPEIEFRLQQNAPNPFN